MDRRGSGSAWGSARSDRGCAPPGWHWRRTGRGQAVSRVGTIDAGTAIACFRPVRQRAKRSRAAPRWPPSRLEQPKPRAVCSGGPSPIAGTLASTYLEARGIAVTPDMTALRFHPRCWYRPEADSPEDARDTWPALIAAVTDKDGAVTGVQRTWLDPSGGAQSAGCGAAAGAGSPAGPRGSLRDGQRRDGGRRGHRDDAVAAPDHARRCLWPLPCRPRILPACCFRPGCAGSTSSATTIRPAGVRTRR